MPSPNISLVKSKGTKIETILSKELWKRGYRFRKNNNSIYGKPDLSLKKYKLAIFCDGEFWHGKNWETRKLDHKSNIDFWHNKIQRNMERDIQVNNYLSQTGWIVLRFWGKDIIKETEKCVQKIETTINDIKRNNI